MATETIDVSSNELIALFNRYALKNQSLAVSAPFLKTTLLNYDCNKGTIIAGIVRDDYDMGRDKILAGSTKFENELPNWFAIQDALLSSGAVPHANASQMQQFLAGLEEAGSNPARPKLIHLAFDTNILYKRWPSRRIGALLGNEQPLLRFALSEGVREELDSKAKAKFGDPDEVKEFATMVGGSQAFKILNRAKRNNRTASNGLGEFDLLAKTRRSIVLDCAPLSSDKEENDRVIAANYSNFDQKPHADVTLVTADSGMLTHAHTFSLPAELLENSRPNSVPEGAIDERVMCKLIHDLAAQFLLIHLAGADISIWSDWHGKRVADWANERMRLEYDPANKMASDFIQDLNASRAVHAASVGQAVVTSIEPPQVVA